MRKTRVAFLSVLALVLLAAGCLYAPTPVPQADGWNLIRNPYFALGVDEGGVPLHWERFGGTDPSTFGLSDEHATVGNLSLKMVDTDPERSAGLRSHKISAQPGERFLLEVDVLVLQGSAMVYLDFHDAEGKRIDAPALLTGVTSGWETISGEATAPEGTDHVTIILYLNIPNVGVVYFDNVRLYRQ